MSRAKRRRRGEWPAVHEAGHAVTLMLTGQLAHMIDLNPEGESRARLHGFFVVSELIEALDKGGVDVLMLARRDALILAAGGAAERVRGGRRPAPRTRVADLYAQGFEERATFRGVEAVCRSWGDSGDLQRAAAYADALVELGRVTDPAAWVAERVEEACELMRRPEVYAAVDRVAAAALAAPGWLLEADALFEALDGVMELGQRLAMLPGARALGRGQERSTGPAPAAGSAS